jgi:hypothetical protein
MQSVARQLQQLDYTNGNLDVFFVVRARSYLEDNWGGPVSSQLQVSL